MFMYFLYIFIFASVNNTIISFLSFNQPFIIINNFLRIFESHNLFFSLPLKMTSCKVLIKIYIYCIYFFFIEIEILGLIYLFGSLILAFRMSICFTLHHYISTVEHTDIA